MSEGSESRRALPFASLAIVTCLALVLRWVAARQSLLGDELFAYAEVTPSSLRQVFHNVNLWENSPPVYLVLAWLSGKLGDPATFIRLPSVIAGTATVPVLYFVGRAIAGVRCAIVAAALFAVLPFAVYYGSEARPYAVLVFLISLSTLSLLKALEGRSGVGWWTLYWLASALALYTHYIAAIALGLQGLWALVTQRRHRRAVVTANAAVALAFLPWVPKLNDNTFLLAASESLHPLTANNIVTDPLRLAVGHPYTPFDHVPGIASLVTTCVVGVFIAISLCLPPLRDRLPRRDAALSDGSPRPARVGWLLASLTAGTVLVTLAYSSVADASIYQARHMITVLPYLCLIGGVAVAALQERSGWVAAGLLVVAALAGSLRMLADYPRPDLHAAAEAIAARAVPGTPVLQPPRLGHNPSNRSFDPLQQDLAIYLNDRFPLSHQIDARDWPRGREVYGVATGPLQAGELDAAARAAGAHLLGTQSFDGILQVTTRRYNVVGGGQASGEAGGTRPLDLYLQQHPGALRSYLEGHPGAERRFRQQLQQGSGAP